LRDAAARARASGKLDEAFATLETANHVNPGDVAVLRDLVELATELSDHTAAARHLTALALRLAGARRGDVLLELADTYYDTLDDAVRGRETMRKAADAFGSGARRDTTLRMLATEAASHLAWDVTVEALLSIPLEKRTQADFTSLAGALLRAGRDADALAAVEAATAAGRFDDGGDLLRHLQHEIQRKIDLVRTLEERASVASADEATALLDEAQQLRLAIGQPGSQPLRDVAPPYADNPKGDTAPWPIRTKTKPGVPMRRVSPAPPAPAPPTTGRTRDTQPRPAVRPPAFVVHPRTEARPETRPEPPREPAIEVPTSHDDEPSSGIPRPVDEPSFAPPAPDDTADAASSAGTAPEAKLATTAVWPTIPEPPRAAAEPSTHGDLDAASAPPAVDAESAANATSADQAAGSPVSLALTTDASSEIASEAPLPSMADASQEATASSIAAMDARATPTTDASPEP
ncbi:MAG: hypothetical protein ACRDMZ_07430, partial [Solirubrobacteraceae bacterium]